MTGMHDQQPALDGTVLDGKYRITRRIGQGGMGAVYQAQHVGTERPVAVKVLLQELVREPEAVERFRREARAAGRLRHPNVVDVTDFGVASVGQRDTAYLVMEYLEGSSLRQTIDERGALPLDVVADITEQIAEALESAHAAGIVHRDLKPDNVWLVHDARGGFAVRVLDFGIARLTHETETPHRSGAPAAPPAGLEADVTMARTSAPDDAAAASTAHRTGADAATVVTPAAIGHDETTARLTTAGSIIGTPLYMSPEQCRGLDADRRSDVYALGVMTYEALTGSRPFNGTMREVIASHINTTAPPVPSVPNAVSAVVLRAMAKSPDERYESARAFAGSLRVASEGAGVIIRRSIAAYAERFHEFLSLSFRVSRPPLFIVATLFALSLLALGLPFDRRLALIPVMVAAVLAPLLWGLVTLMTNAIFAAAVERLRLRPLERLEPSELLADLRKRLSLPATAGYGTTLRHLIAYYVRCELHAPVGTGDLAFLIGFLEGRALTDIPARCTRLAEGSRRAYSRVRAAIFAALFALPVVEAALLALAFRPLGAKGLILAMLIALALVPLNAMLINPVFSTALALLYFRSRQANGEDVALAAVLPGRL